MSLCAYYEIVVCVQTHKVVLTYIYIVGSLANIKIEDAYRIYLLHLFIGIAKVGNPQAHRSGFLAKLSLYGPIETYIFVFLLFHFSLLKYYRCAQKQAPAVAIRAS